MTWEHCSVGGHVLVFRQVWCTSSQVQTYLQPRMAKKGRAF
jgi:hypothetical protein